MHNRFYLSLLILSAVILFIFTAFATYKEVTPEWKKYQVQYKKEIIQNTKDDTIKKKAKALPVNVQQIYVNNLKRIDRCTSCHIGIENPLMANAKAPLKQHSGNYLKDHPLDKFGCTACHHGQGRATNKKEAHGIEREAHWDYPIIPLKYIQSSCVQCHDLDFLRNNGAGSIVKGEKLFREKGCKGCHKLNGVGGSIGKPLDDVGSRPVANFAMRYVTGEKTIYLWHKQHLIDPQDLVPESEMRISVTDEEADYLTTYVLSLRAEEMPKSYRRIRDIRIYEEAADQGEVLYNLYCIACHTTGKSSVFDEMLRRPIPAIMNPSFLRVADDKFLKKVIEEGRLGTQMTSWKASAGGFTEDEINKVIKFITKDRPSSSPEQFDFRRFMTDIKHGEELFNVRCALCHGKKGEGEIGINLKNPVVQDVEPEFLAITVRDGRAGTPMPPFGKSGVGLKEQDIADVVAYVKTLAQKK